MCVVTSSIYTSIRDNSYLFLSSYKSIIRCDLGNNAGAWNWIPYCFLHPSQSRFILYYKTTDLILSFCCLINWYCCCGDWYCWPFYRSLCCCSSHCCFCCLCYYCCCEGWWRLFSWFCCCLLLFMPSPYSMLALIRL